MRKLQNYTFLNQELQFLFSDHFKFNYNKSENAINGFGTGGIFAWADFTNPAVFPRPNTIWINRIGQKWWWKRGDPTESNRPCNIMMRTVRWFFTPTVRDEIQFRTQLKTPKWHFAVRRSAVRSRFFERVGCSWLWSLCVCWCWKSMVYSGSHVKLRKRVVLLFDVIVDVSLKL